MGGTRTRTFMRGLPGRPSSMTSSSDPSAEGGDSRRSEVPWRAIAAVAAPGLLALLIPVLTGDLSIGFAAAGAALVVVGSGVVLHRHFLRLDALRRYIVELGHSGSGPMPRPPRAGSPILSPGLESALAAAAAERQRRRGELEALISGNEAILATLPDPLVMLDKSRRIVRANPAAIALFGDTLAGRDLTSVLRSPKLLGAADAVLSGDVDQIVDFTIPGPVQRTFSAQVKHLPTPAPDGTVAILALHDLTSVRRAEQLRADFVANASHELRTPLSSLLGFVETLRGPAREDEEARHRFLAIMHEQAVRMSHLVEDLLSLSRIEMQEHTPPTGTADLIAVLSSVIGTLDLRAKEKDMALVLDAPAPLPVIGESEELAQVFQNLIDNAIKYGRAGTEVRVKVVESDAARRRLGRRGLAVSVIDKGEGIGREHLPRLTERFYRVDTARSRQLGGTGLGLAIVKHIVNRHRGALEISSTEGEGSTFTVLLPLADVAAADAAAE